MRSRVALYLPEKGYQRRDQRRDLIRFRRRALREQLSAVMHLIYIKPKILGPKTITPIAVAPSALNNTDAAATSFAFSTPE